jgi:hypothetical protein
MMFGDTGAAVAGLGMQHAPLFLGKTQFWQENVAPYWNELHKFRQMGPGTGDPAKMQQMMNARRYMGAYVTPAIGKAIVDSPGSKIIDAMADKLGLPAGLRLSNADPNTVGMIVKQLAPAMPEAMGILKQFVPQMLIDDSGLQRAAMLLNKGGYSKQAIDQVFGGFYKALNEGKIPANMEPEMVASAMARAVEVHGPKATYEHALNLSNAAMAVRSSWLVNPADIGGALRMASSGRMAQQVMTDPSSVIKSFGEIRQMAEATGLDPGILQSSAEAARRVGMSPLALGRLIAKNSALLRRHADDPDKAEKIIGNSIQHYASLAKGGQSGGVLAYAASKNPKLVERVIAKGPEAVAKFVRDLSRNPAARRASRYLSTEDINPALMTDAAMEGISLANEMHKARAYRNKDGDRLLAMAQRSPEKFKQFMDNKHYASNPRLAKMYGSRGLSPGALSNYSTLGIKSTDDDFKQRWNDAPTATDQPAGLNASIQPTFQPQQPNQTNPPIKFKV